MTITFIPGNRKQKYLLIALGVILLGGVGILWYRFFGGAVFPSFPSQPPPPGEIRIDFTVFQNPAFLKLGDPRPPILPPEQVGKRDPFMRIP